MTMPLANGLTAYWIAIPRYAAGGFGVTAWTLEDALAMLTAFGWELPEDLNTVVVTSDITFEEAARRNWYWPLGGPINVRGVWCPFTTMGVPGWAAERMARLHDRRDS